MRGRLAALAVSALAAVLAAGASHAHGPADETRRLTFPKTADGRSVLAVDLHTHSVFSDGGVWPSVRVEESRRDGLFAMAVTEHLEYQPHSADIPHPDRNRAFAIASDAAKVKADAKGLEAQPLEVLNGAEITKFNMATGGHMNAVFITDANALKVLDAREQLRIARSQGAFTFWNHPYWTAQTPDGVARLDDLHRKLIKDGLLQGIEVANGADMSEEAFQIALDNNLTILGTSDVHGLIDWEADIANGGHRTATLVLADEATPEGVRKALVAGKTVAIFRRSLIGRAENVEAVIRGALTAEAGAYLPRTTVVPVMFRNDSPVDMVLESVGPTGFYDATGIVTVKAGSNFTVMVRNVPDLSKLKLTFRVLNAWTGPNQHLLLDMTPAQKG